MWAPTKANLLTRQPEYGKRITCNHWIEKHGIEVRQNEWLIMVISQQYGNVLSGGRRGQIICSGIIYLCQSITEFYALPGIRDFWDCIDHADRWYRRGVFYQYNSCFISYCREDFERPTLPFLQAFLTASGCNSLHELKRGDLNLFGRPWPYYYCRLVTI